MTDLFMLPPRILLVDDDPLMVRLLSRVIERSLGDEIEFACRYTAVSTGWSSIYPERVILE